MIKCAQGLQLYFHHLTMKNNGKRYIEELISEGEHEHQDFKFQISDARKIARSISAFANNTGGRLLVGVKDNGHIAGVASEEEIHMIEQAASMFCKPALKVEFSQFRIQGKCVLKVDIQEAARKPVLAPDENGRWRAYFRVADENVVASNLHVKVMRHDAATGAHVVLSFTKIEHTLLGYLETHGGISLPGFMRLAHVSRQVAEDSAMRLCEMGVVRLNYHDGHCLLSKSNEE